MSHDEIILENGFMPNEVRVEPTYSSDRESRRYTGVLVLHLATGNQAVSEDSESEIVNLGLALQLLRQKLQAAQS